MWGWAIFAGYLIGSVVSFRLVAPHMLARNYEKNKKEYPYAAARCAEIDRGFVLTGAFFASLFWFPVMPILIIGSKIFSTVNGAEFLRPPAEIEEEEKRQMGADREELARLRRLAREYNLPFGDD